MAQNVSLLKLLLPKVYNKHTYPGYWLMFTHGIIIGLTSEEYIVHYCYGYGLGKR